MAIFYTDIGLIQNDANANNSGKRADAVKVTGNLNCAIVTWTSTTAMVDEDYIRLVKLPSKSIVHPDMCTVHTSVVLDSAAVNISIGDDHEWTHITPDEDRYMQTTDVVTADETIVWAPLGTSQTTAAMVAPYVTTKEGWVDARIKTATGALAAGGIASFRIIYSVLS